jgi:hypothetical protein
VSSSISNKDILRHRAPRDFANWHSSSPAWICARSTVPSRPWRPSSAFAIGCARRIRSTWRRQWHSARTDSSPTTVGTSIAIQITEIDITYPDML